MQLNTQLLVDRLVQRIDLDRIFLFNFLNDSVESPHLLLVVNPVKGISVQSIEPIIRLCMADMPDIPFHVIWTGEWSNQLKKGSLYYTYASLPAHLLYQADSKKTPILGGKLVVSLMEMSHVDYAKGKNLADEFMFACYNFQSKTDYFQATAMLHQFIVLRLKGFQTMAGVTIGKAQNLEHILKLMRGTLPGLFKIFTYDTHSTPLLRLLDTCHVYSKKKDRFDILEEEFEFLLAHCQAFGQALDSMVDFIWNGVAVYLKERSDHAATVPVDKESAVVMVKKVQSIVAGPIIMENFSSFPWPQKYKDDANALIDKIYSVYRPEQILLVNYQTVGFSKGNPFHDKVDVGANDIKMELYLVVLTKKSLPFSFRRRHFGDVGASLVFLDLPYVEKHLAMGSRFVNIVWEKSYVLRQKSTFNSQLVPGEVDWSRKLEKIKVIADNAIAVMRNLLMTMTDAPLLMPDAALLLLRELHHIGIHTYLRCAIGFIPKNMDLQELMDWSAIASFEVIDGVLGGNEINKLILSIILKPNDIWWKSLAMDMDEKHEAVVITQGRAVVELYERLFKGVVHSIEQRVAAHEGNVK
ncbi:hypothetical protein KO02_03275 [Sphingobacterium sp. ML3W]|uniref:hypothetical protein n=1 Tax=Sphingobacterium sp. ML3W TaxID=1538644 RepID=UPI0004F662D5|nr:hypothetical protein [Sphingobacterium sp. ML3W]AIM35805.1 hypothetical protein KO02_03275 [Sphingobacterium sp. ML3W]